MFHDRGVFRTNEKWSTLEHLKCPRKYQLKSNVTLTYLLTLACSNHLSGTENDPFFTTYPFIKHKKAIHTVQLKKRNPIIN